MTTPKTKKPSTSKTQKTPAKRPPTSPGKKPYAPPALKTLPTVGISGVESYWAGYITADRQLHERKYADQVFLTVLDRLLQKDTEVSPADVFMDERVRADMVTAAFRLTDEVLAQRAAKLRDGEVNRWGILSASLAGVVALLKDRKEGKDGKTAAAPKAPEAPTAPAPAAKKTPETPAPAVFTRKMPIKDEPANATEARK